MIAHDHFGLSSHRIVSAGLAHARVHQVVQSLRQKPYFGTVVLLIRKKDFFLDIEQPEDSDL